MRRLLIATTNRGKLVEIRSALRALDVELLTLGDLQAPVAPPDETGWTFAQNARAKAVYYAGVSGLETVAEDSGLEVDALGGAPGVESARYGGESLPYPERFARLCAALDRQPGASRSARFVCALALADPSRVLFEASGVVEGAIAAHPTGSAGFGYDPIFFYPPFGCTFAEAGDRKLAVSHRAHAFARLADYLSRRCS